MIEKRTYSTETTYEKEFGFNRAVRAGNTVRIAGTTAVEDGEVVDPGEPYEQAKFVLDRIEESLEEVDASMDDVVLTRVLVEDFGLWESIGRAHRESFSDPSQQPASTMMAVAALPEEGMVLEIEAEAVVE